MNAGLVGAAEALRQMVTGENFEPPERLLALRPRRAVTVPEGAPYSVATNVAHAEYWQRVLLARLKGLVGPGTFEDESDFPEVSEREWPPLRDAFLRGMAEALRMAETGEHAMEDDQSAMKVFTEIVIHNMYHLGEVKLLKRVLAGQNLGG